MKVTLNAEGRLKIQAETELESYGLKQWWKNYNPEGEGESVLEVESTVVIGIMLSDKKEPDPLKFPSHAPFGPIARGYGNPVIPGELTSEHEYAAAPQCDDNRSIKALAAEGLSEGGRSER